MPNKTVLAAILLQQQTVHAKECVYMWGGGEFALPPGFTNLVHIQLYCL